MSATGGSVGERTMALPAGATGNFFNGQLSYQAQTIGELDLMPVWLPVDFKIAQFGVQVSVAGSADSTVQPCIYSMQADSSPGNIRGAGTVFAGNVIGDRIAAFLGTLSAGWYFVGALTLGTTSPQILSCVDPSHSPYGSVVRRPAPGFGRNWASSGLGALPNPFAGFPASGATPAPIFVMQ